MIHKLIPQSVSGYQLDEEQSFWQVCRAEETTNLMLNPSFEIDEDLGADASLALGGYMGSTSCLATYVARTVTPVTTAVHTFSAYMGTPPDVPSVDVELQVLLGGDVLKTRRYTIRRTLDWMRIDIQWNATASSTYTMRIFSHSPEYFITDCWQVEAKPYATTYVDGDLGVMFPDDAAEFFWNGTPHQSSSTRTAKTRMGGRWIGLDEFGFMTTSISGFGQAPVEQSFQVALSGKYIPEAMYFGQRELVIGGTIMARTHSELIRKRRELTDIFSPLHLGEWKPLRLKVVLEVDGSEYEILAYYSDGMQGELDNLYRQNWAILLKTEVPYWEGGPRTSAVFTALDGATYYVLSRDWDTGVWSRWTRDQTAGTTYAMDHDGAGNYYTAGTHTGLVHRLRPAGESTTTTFGGGITGTVAKALAVSKSGPLSLVALGTLTASATNIAMNVYRSGAWQGNTIGVYQDYPWNPGVVVDIDETTVNAVEWVNGEFYVGGSFSKTYRGGFGANAQQFDLLAAYNPVTNTWRKVGVYALQRGNNAYGVDPGASFYDTHTVTGLRYGGDGYLYISGKWLPNTGFTSNSIVRYNIAANIIEDVSPAKTMDADFYGLYSMAVSPTGVLHGIGYDPAITKLMYPTGDTWVERTMQQEGTFTNKVNIDFAPDGTLLLGGSLYQWSDMTPQPYSLLWQIAPAGSNPPFAPLDLIYDVATAPSKGYTALRVMNRKAFIAIDGNGGAVVMLGTHTTVTNRGTEVTRYGLYISQATTLYSIRNETTGKQIVLDSPIVLPPYGYAAIFERNGALYMIDLTLQNDKPRLIKFNRALSDIGALDLVPGVNTLDIMHSVDYSAMGGNFIYMTGITAFWRERHSTL